MTGPDLWISYGLPAFGVVFGLVGLAVAWISARRFDARFADVEVPAPVERAPRVTPYRKPSKHPRRGSPGRPASMRP